MRHLFTLLLFLPFAVSAQVQLQFSLKVSNLGDAVDIVGDRVDSSRFFIVLQSGVIKIADGANVLSTDYLDVSALISSGGERGLLSLAFHPDYVTNGYFFVLYTASGNGALTLARYQRSATSDDSATFASGVVLKTIPHPNHANHNGGKIHFGSDGNLYWSTGDGGGGGDVAGNAQNGNNLLGKMLRYNVDSFTTSPYYTIPSTNPFISDPAINDEIWSIGLRNPFRWSFDRFNGDMWIADVGQDSLEEVNVVPGANTGGRNYGWNCYEGPSVFKTPCTPTFTPLTMPIFHYPQNMSTGGFAITGGYVYRGSQFPNLYGKYICADFVSGNVWLLTQTGSVYTSQIYTGLPSNISAFGENVNGELFAVSLSGNLYKIIDANPQSVSSLAPGSALLNMHPNIIEDQTIRFQTDVTLNNFSVFDITGKEVFKSTGIYKTGTHDIHLPNVVKGIYYVRAFSESTQFMNKIIIN